MTLLSQLVQGPSAGQRILGTLSLLGALGGGGSLPQGGGMVDLGMGGGGGSHWEQVAQQMAAKRGWTGADWKAIDSIIERESGWDPKAVNPNGGAYGIPQILPSAHPGVHLQNNPLGQIKWLLNYIGGRYGDPSSALAFKDSHGWY